MTGEILAILMLVGVVAFIVLIVFLGIYSRRLNKKVNDLKMPPNIEQIRSKSRWFAYIVIIISLVFAYLIVYRR